MRLVATCTAALLAVFMPAAAAAGPALLFEVGSGKVLYAEDLDDAWYPASLTKIMTAYLTFEALKSGRLRLDAQLDYSENAAQQPPSKIGMKPGEKISVEQALKALIIKSANDIAVTLAEGIGGSEEAFVKLMNEKARRLGMGRTRFVNPNGLPAAGQVTSARDLGKLARAVVRDFPQYNAYWSLEDMHVGKIRLKSHNDLLGRFPGADGLKTGFICDSGFNIVASATRDGLRLMAVVLGESTSGERQGRAASLLEHGYGTREWKALKPLATIDSMKLSPKAKPVVSIRKSVKAWACGYRPAQANSAKARKARVTRKRAAKAKVGRGTTKAAQPAAAAKP